MKKISLGCILLLLSSVAMAADFDEKALKEEMHKVCAPLFETGGACADLAKGTRNCVRQNLDKGGASCAAFEKAQQAFFDAGKEDAPVKK